MSAPAQLEQSRAYPVTVEHAFDVVLPTTLEGIFCRRYGAIPPVRAVCDQEGVWGTVGQTRTVVLADAGTMHDLLTVVERPDRFGYRSPASPGP